MNKTIIKIFMLMTFLLILTGCASNNSENVNKKQSNDNDMLINQNYDGLEFVNVKISNNEIVTVVINNTGYTYEGSKFKIKIMDESGNTIKEIIDKVSEKVENGTTKTIKTKVNIDLSKASSIEYSIIK